MEKLKINELLNIKIENCEITETVEADQGTVVLPDGRTFERLPKLCRPLCHAAVSRIVYQG